MNTYFTSDKPKEPACIMVTAAIMNLSDADLNNTAVDGVNGATFGRLPVGTIIHTVGYAALKQKGLDGSWTAL